MASGAQCSSSLCTWMNTSWRLPRAPMPAIHHALLLATTYRLPLLPQGIPTLVLTDATGPELAAAAQEGRAWNETWLSYADFPHSFTGKPFDQRAAAAPLLALDALGARDPDSPTAFTWLISGDDDVAFFWPGLLQMPEGLNPQDPFFLSGKLACVASKCSRPGVAMPVARSTASACC